MGNPDSPVGGDHPISNCAWLAVAVGLVGLGGMLPTTTVSAEPVTDLPLESVTVTWNMYEALDHLVVSNEKVAPVSDSEL